MKWISLSRRMTGVGFDYWYDNILFWYISTQVLFNLANQYAANEIYAEALSTYQVIVKNKMFSNAGKWLCTFWKIRQ